MYPLCICFFVLKREFRDTLSVIMASLGSDVAADYGEDEGNAHDVDKLSDITSGLLRELELKKDDLRIAAEMGQLLLKKNADISNENAELQTRLKNLSNDMERVEKRASERVRVERERVNVTRREMLLLEKENKALRETVRKVGKTCRSFA